MISILIPVYNFAVVDLVQELSNQIKNGSFDCEIIVMDDGSAGPFLNLNANLSSIPYVVYQPLAKNYGRIEIRQRLAQKATYNWLLFLDGDSKIISPVFLANYYQQINNRGDVIVGGREYMKQKPKNCSLVLHWKYGRERETGNMLQKNMHPYYGFMSNNFSIKKSLFTSLQFDNRLQGYGHEDTWIGMQLEAAKANVIYINNPTLHLGLEPAEIFIEKSKNAVLNILRLEKLVEPEVVQRHIKLYRVYRRIKKLKAEWIINSILNIAKPFILKISIPAILR